MITTKRKGMLIKYRFWQTDIYRQTDSSVDSLIARLVEQLMACCQRRTVTVEDKLLCDQKREGESDREKQWFKERARSAKIASKCRACHPLFQTFQWKGFDKVMIYDLGDLFLMSASKQNDNTNSIKSWSIRVVKRVIVRVGEWKLEKKIGLHCRVCAFCIVYMDSIKPILTDRLTTDKNRDKICN